MNVCPSVNRRVVLAILTAVFAATSLTGFNLFKRKPKVAGPPEAGERDLITQIQIFLDTQNFGPGKIDGSLGEFTYKAVNLYNAARGAAPEDLGNWHTVIEEAKSAIPHPYAAYQIKEADFKFINADLPDKPEEQEKLDFLGYRNVAEFVAEKFHTDMGFLNRINPKEAIIYTMKPGDVIIVPNVPAFQIETIKRHQKFEKDAVLSSNRVVIDTKGRVATFYNSQNQIISAFPITPGQEKFIPYGEWKVVNMITTPYFRWDDKMLKEGKRSDESWNLPPGPNNPVGIFWAGISKSGIGLHGTRDPRSIGRSQSAGCIRFANWDAIRLSNFIRPGSRVDVR